MVMRYNKPSYPLYDQQVELAIRALVCYYSLCAEEEQERVKLLLADLILAQLKYERQEAESEKAH